MLIACVRDYILAWACVKLILGRYKLVNMLTDATCTQGQSVLNVCNLELVGGVILC